MRYNSVSPLPNVRPSFEISRLIAIYFASSSIFDYYQPYLPIWLLVMPKIYLPLPTLLLQPNTSYVHAHEPPSVIHWDDLALDTMVDFKYIRPATIKSDETINTALLEMKATGFYVLLVVDSEQKIVGLISSEDLLGEKPLQAVQEKRIPRSDILVNMIMTPQSEIIALNIDELRHAKVGHIVNTLKTAQQHYALVIKIDEITHSQTVRGLFSASMLSRQLGENVTNDLSQAHSLAELQHDLSLDS